MTKVLITGGMGVIGLSLAKELHKQGQRITICDNLSKWGLDRESKEFLKDKSIKLIKCDLTDSKQIKKLKGPYDYVYHLAAINGTKHFYEKPQEVLRVNVLSCVNILDWFKKQQTGKILFSSSNEAYASYVNRFMKPLPTPEDVMLAIDDPYNPRWSYGGSKLIGELFFINYAKHYNFDMSIVRYHNNYGPRMGNAHVIPDFIRRIKEKKNPFPIYGWKETRAFCYISDTIEATQIVMESSKTNMKTIHIGNDKAEISMIDLAKKLFDISKFHPKIKKCPAPEGSVKRRCPDINRLRDLGFRPKVYLDEGLEKTFRWYKDDSSS